MITVFRQHVPQAPGTGQKMPNLLTQCVVADDAQRLERYPALAGDDAGHGPAGAGVLHEPVKRVDARATRKVERLQQVGFKRREGVGRLQ